MSRGRRTLKPRLFVVGEQVRKTSGYSYPGEVRCRFTTRAGKVRYVVEATGAEYDGMLHIFEGDRLAPANYRGPIDDEQTISN